MEADSRNSWTVLRKEHQMKEDGRVLWEDTVLCCSKAGQFIFVECWQRVVDKRGVEFSRRRDSKWNFVIQRKYEDGMSLAEKEFVIFGHVGRIWYGEPGSWVYDALADNDFIIRPRDDEHTIWITGKPDAGSKRLIYV
ncbi:hypothetical protein CABS01_16857 [Colletotrichum abscissum]|uniref:uncharacterized protein n=1 Tax=Colletotrichum abscissum TaxID=1671311 RepID=UPI0027D4EB57|nr:uncharacterized protein CABS01_16857 [Colletotrichum abscissum]KAK1509293.1 hypothetical protein CABS01_16857 [Colletotrichum abscissum]